MPVSLFLLPPHICDSVIEKFNLPDFVNFHQSSQKSLEVATQVKTRFTLEIPESVDQFGNCLPNSHLVRLRKLERKIEMDIYKSVRCVDHLYHAPYRIQISDFPVRLKDFHFIITEPFSEEFCIELTNFILQTNSSLDSLSLHKVQCSPAALKQLMETEKVKELVFFGRIAPDYMIIEEILTKSMFIFGYMNQADILCFNAPRFSIRSSNLTSSGINQILKQLIEGRRIIEFYFIRTDQTLKKDVVLEGIPILSRVSFGYFETVHFGSIVTYKIDLGFDSVTISKSPFETVQN